MRWVAIGALILVSCSAAWAVERGNPLEGLWLTQDRGGVIRLSPCETGLCGWIVGLDLEPGEVPQRDPQGRSQCGFPLIGGLQQTGSNEWRGGITNPRDGRTYDARLSLDETGRLNLRGYLLVPLFGSTQTWTRYGGTVTADCRMVAR